MATQELIKTTEVTAYDIPSDNVIHQRLLFAYHKTMEYVNGDLLEIGCGVGKGVELFSDKCRSYTAVDKNDALILHLSEKYPQHNFVNKFIPPLTDFKDQRFDTVVTQQVIEHIEDDNLFLKEIQRVLKPEGKAIITTPNIKMSLTRNPWHVREYTAIELQTLLQKHFSKVLILGITGNKKVMDYYEENKKSVEKITRFDILNLQYRLPRQLLQIPYDILNRMNRKKLLSNNTGLVSSVSIADYTFTEDVNNAFDFFCVVEK